LRMAKSLKNRARCLIIPVLLFWVLGDFAPSPRAAAANTSLERDIRTALLRSVRCKGIEVKAVGPGGTNATLSNLTIRFEGVVLERLTADYMTVTYENVRIDANELRKTGRLVLPAASPCKAGILVSVASLRAFFDTTAATYHKKYNRLAVKFTPPYLESEFEIPSSEFSKLVRNILEKYTAQNQVGGYSCVSLSARQNKLYCRSEKTILQHFLLPKEIVQFLEKRWNPFYEIPLVGPFQYSINQVAIQNNYIYLSN
jgi:hypothetical protein